MKNKILIQTALSLEFAAVKLFLQNIQIVKHPETGSVYNIGEYNKWQIMLVETGPGNVRAADETSRAINFFKPGFVFFVGIAGGIKDVKIGDVVASSKVIGFEMGKDDLEFKPRFDTSQASYKLEQLAKHVMRENKWLRKTKVQNPITPNAFVQPIAAGEKVVSSNRSASFNYLRNFCSEAVAVDMEGNGFLIASRPSHSHAIEIRGISDLIENKAESDATGSQPLAAGNASAFCFEMIDQIEPEDGKVLPDNPKDLQQQLLKDVLKLYPNGPEQDDIWKRAGGDVCILINSTSRKSQWFQALEKLFNGGGGKDISIEQLIITIQEDYPTYQLY